MKEPSGMLFPEVVAAGWKFCKTCGKVKRLAAFGVQRLRAKGHDGRRSKCRVCRGTYDSRRRSSSNGRIREYQRRWHENHREAGRSYHLKTKFRMTIQQYDRLLASQGGVCALCGIAPTGDGLRLAVDHDHSCCPGKKSCGKCIRGLLCGSCNSTALPAFENVEWVERAVQYLQAYKRARAIA